VGGAGGCVVHNEHVFLQLERMSTTCVSCRPMCPSILQDMPATERRTETSWHEKEDSCRIFWSWQLTGALTPELDEETRKGGDKGVSVGVVLGALSRYLVGSMDGALEGLSVGAVREFLEGDPETLLEGCADGGTNIWMVGCTLGL